MALATAGFALVHSALASRKAKAIAAQFPRGTELYRAVYNAQSLAMFGGLTWYIATRPTRTLYHLRGPAAAAMRAAQIGVIAWAVAAARATGVMKLAGLDNLFAVIRGEPARPVPAAQGPEMGEDGRLRSHGPFAISRHPLNLAPLPPFWLTPHMTTRRLAFNVIASVYLVAGSWHEELRLRSTYGHAYARYQRSGVPFYAPRVMRRRIG